MSALPANLRLSNRIFGGSWSCVIAGFEVQPQQAELGITYAVCHARMSALCQRADIQAP